MTLSANLCSPLQEGHATQNHTAKGPTQASPHWTLIHDGVARDAGSTSQKVVACDAEL